MARLLVESLPTARLLMLTNYRPEYSHGWGSKTYYQQVRLDTLPAASAGELLEALLGTGPGLADLERLLIERTQGNPFFLEESVRALVETRALTGERGAYRLAGPIQRLQLRPRLKRSWPRASTASLRETSDCCRRRPWSAKTCPSRCCRRSPRSQRRAFAKRSPACRRRNSSTKRGFSRSLSTRSNTRSRTK